MHELPRESALELKINCWIHAKGILFSNCAQAIKGAEKGEPAAILLSPCSSPPIHHASGSLFTMFLTSPLQAFYLLLGFSGSDSEMVC